MVTIFVICVFRFIITSCYKIVGKRVINVYSHSERKILIQFWVVFLILLESIVRFDAAATLCAARHHTASLCAGRDQWPFQLKVSPVPQFVGCGVLFDQVVSLWPNTHGNYIARRSTLTDLVLLHNYFKISFV